MKTETQTIDRQSAAIDNMQLLAKVCYQLLKLPIKIFIVLLKMYFVFFAVIFGIGFFTKS